MGVSREQLAAIIGGKARELCSPEGDSMINEAARINRGEGYLDEDPSNYDGDAAYFDSLFTNEVEAPKPKMRNNGNIQYNERGLANSRLDEKIKDSFRNNPIDKSALDPYGRSVIDDLNIQPKQRPSRQQVTEQRSYGNSGGIDYSIIKAIVNECLNDYFSKQPINESATLSTIGLKDGNIKLVDNKGNVYSAKLQKLGNKNDK